MEKETWQKVKCMCNEMIYKLNKRRKMCMNKFLNDQQYITRVPLNVGVLDYCFCCKEANTNGTTKYTNFNMKHLHVVPKYSTLTLV